MNEDANAEDAWTDDLFGREAEASQLHSYIVSVAGRPRQREDKAAFTLAVEGSYGQGKTFFLKRLAKHLKHSHPVAYYDAWSDDFTDEPLTALAATLKEALGLFPDKAKVDTFLAKTGKVSKIIGKGLLRRGAALVITESAVSALDALDVTTDDDIEDDISKLAEGASDDATSDAGDAAASKMMIDRIAQYENQRLSMQSVKDSLNSIVSSLDEAGLSPPIIIIIDELDRCRPSYAVKILEEIKHLFDVDGVVFILGMNLEQLGHSISGVYGSNFDGHAYVKRFIDRTYRMREAPLENLLKVLWHQAALNDAMFELPQIVIPGERGVEVSRPEFIAELMRYYGLTARDTFEVMDMLQTSSALVKTQKIDLAYYLPMIFGAIKGNRKNELPDPVGVTKWHFLTTNWRKSGDGDPVSPDAYVKTLHNLLSQPYSELYEVANSEDATVLHIMASRAKSLSIDPLPIWSLASYHRLLTTVARFSNPENDTMEQ